MGIHIDVKAVDVKTLFFKDLNRKLVDVKMGHKCKLESINFDHNFYGDISFSKFRL